MDDRFGSEIWAIVVCMMISASFVSRSLVKSSTCTRLSRMSLCRLQYYFIFVVCSLQTLSGWTERYREATAHGGPLHDSLEIRYHC